jgi:hypothetical protein
MNRRTFVKSAAVAASAGPLFLGIKARAATLTPVIGVDGHKFECNHDWLKLPNDYEWQTTHNVAVDSQGLIYITHQGVGKLMDTILVFDGTGQFVRSFGKDFHGGGHGIEIRKEGSDEFCYLSNSFVRKNDLKLMKTTLKGEVVWTKGRPKTKEYEDTKKGYAPTNINFLPDGGFVVGDGYGSHYMMHYDKAGEMTKIYGGAGTTDGKFRTPHGNGYDARDPKNPMIVVCDRANNRLQRFTPDGTFISATKPNEVVLFPANARTHGDVLLVPDLHSRVSLFDKNNKPIVHLGEQTAEDTEWRKKVVASLGAKAPSRPIRVQPKEWTPGRFAHPHDATFDKAGNLIVVEWVSTGRITMLKKVG